MPAIADIADALLHAAKREGAHSADAIVTEGGSVEVEVRCGQLEHVERSEGAAAGLRVFVGHRQACVSGSDLRPESLAAMAEEAVAMARAAPEDPHCGLARPDQLAADTGADRLELADPSPPPALEDLKETALEAEAAALAVEGVAKSESAEAGCSSREIHLAASNGFSGSYKRTGVSVSCAAISGAGLEMEVDYCLESRVFAADLPQPAAVGRLAGERAAARAGPAKPPTGAYPVLFDERVAGSLVGHLLSAINGAAVARGSTWLRDAVGSAVLSDNLDLCEDPLLPRRQASRPFDAEGLPTARRRIVRGGVLQDWILDLATARKLELESTANATRDTGSAPVPGVTNIRLPDGAATRDELIAQMGTGLIVTSLIGSTINPTTGDYSRGASGFWVADGELTGPVSEFTIAGNLKRVLRSLIPANDSRPFRRFRVPSLLTEGLTVAGS